MASSSAALKQQDALLQKTLARLEQLEESVRPISVSQSLDERAADSRPTAADLEYDPFGVSSLPSYTGQTEVAAQATPSTLPSFEESATRAEDSCDFLEQFTALKSRPQAQLASVAPEAFPLVPTSPFPIASPPQLLTPQPSAASEPAMSQASADLEQSSRAHSTSWAHLQRRRTAIARQAHRYSGLAAREVSLREQGGWTATVQSSMSKASELLRKAEELITDAELADDVFTKHVMAHPRGADKTEAYRGAEHRALRSKHACETGYSRLCLAIDTAERNIGRAAGGIPVKPVSSAPQMRSTSFTMDTRTPLSSRPEPFASEAARPAGTGGPLQAGRSTWSPASLGKGSVHGAKHLDRVSTSSIDSAPPSRQPPAAAGPRAGRPGHRRTVSDSGAWSDQTHGDANAALAAMFQELEKRRLALND